ncbi:MAG: hypothetical protein VXY77_03875 [Pseudomonadota bacterium]|nr:hypothetical protein [Pseudomonadota bacterium]
MEQATKLYYNPGQKELCQLWCVLHVLLCIMFPGGFLHKEGIPLFKIQSFQITTPPLDGYRLFLLLYLIGSKRNKDKLSPRQVSSQFDNAAIVIYYCILHYPQVRMMAAIVPYLSLDLISRSGICQKRVLRELPSDIMLNIALNPSLTEHEQQHLKKTLRCLNKAYHRLLPMRSGHLKSLPIPVLARILDEVLNRPNTHHARVVKPNHDIEIHDHNDLITLNLTSYPILRLVCKRFADHLNLSATQNLYSQSIFSDSMRRKPLYGVPAQNRYSQPIYSHKPCYGPPFHNVSQQAHVQQEMLFYRLWWSCCVYYRSHYSLYTIMKLSKTDLNDILNPDHLGILEHHIGIDQEHVDFKKQPGQDIIESKPFYWTFVEDQARLYFRLSPIAYELTQPWLKTITLAPCTLSYPRFHYYWTESWVSGILNHLHELKLFCLWLCCRQSWPIYFNYFKINPVANRINFKYLNLPYVIDEMGDDLNIDLFTDPRNNLAICTPLEHNLYGNTFNRHFLRYIMGDPTRMNTFESHYKPGNLHKTTCYKDLYLPIWGHSTHEPYTSMDDATIEIQTRYGSEHFHADMMGCLMRAAIKRQNFFCTTDFFDETQKPLFGLVDS